MLGRRVGLVQLRSTEDVARNAARCRHLIREAKAQGAQLVCLPECFDYVGRSVKESVSLAEGMHGERMECLQEAARSEGIWLSLGGFHCGSSEEQGKLRNTHVVVNDAGDVVSTYVKTHLFDVEVEGGQRLFESAYTEPGGSLVACESPVGKLGLSICYDLRFPEVYSHLRFKQLADLLLVPSAFMVPTGRAHWHMLLCSRAVENQCFVLAAAQVGQHNEKRASYGHSLVVDPWGEVCLDMGVCGDPDASLEEMRESVECQRGPVKFLVEGEQEEEEEQQQQHQQQKGAVVYLCKERDAALGVVDLDFEVLEKVRRNMPVEKHRREELYGNENPFMQ